MKKIYTRTAVILCGGKGTRLGLLGKRIPKCLVEVQNRPIIWYIINILRKNSFNHFILPIGYKGHMIKKFFKLNKTFKDLNIEIVETEQRLIYELTVGDGDYGKVIGKGGRNISALRTLVFAINAKEGGKRARLDVID